MSSAFEPNVVAIYVRKVNEDEIVAYREGEPKPEAGALPESKRLVNSGAHRKGFADEGVQRALGEVLFEDPTVRQHITDGLSNSGHLRIVLDLDGDEAAFCWEAAIPPADFVQELGVESLPVGLWERTAVIRRSQRYLDSSGHYTMESLFPNPESRAGYVIDARSVKDPVLTNSLPTELNTPFEFTVGSHASRAAFAATAFGDSVVLHYVGHATGSGLYLDGGGGSWEQIREKFQNTKIRLAVLEACGTAGSPSSGERLSFAWSMAQSVPAVLGMLDEILDDAASTFMGEFYGALSEGFPVDFAVARARRKLNAWGKDQDTSRSEYVKKRDAWMLPILFLSVSGDSVVHTAPVHGSAHEVPAAHDALVLAREGVSLKRLVWSAGSIAVRPMKRIDTRSHNGGVVHSATGDVAAALDDGVLYVQLGDEALEPDERFARAFSANSMPVRLLAIQTLYGFMVQVLVSCADGTFSAVRARGGEWGSPTLVAGETLVSAVLLHDGFVGIDADGDEVVADPRHKSLPDVGSEWRRFIGVDAVELDEHDLIAFWGEGWDGEAVGSVFTRQLAGPPLWREVSVDPPLRGISRLGLPRAVSSSITLPPSLLTPIVVSVRSNDGHVVEHQFDTSAVLSS